MNAISASVGLEKLHCFSPQHGMRGHVYMIKEFITM